MHWLKFEESFILKDYLMSVYQFLLVNDNVNYYNLSSYFFEKISAINSDSFSK